MLVFHLYIRLPEGMTSKHSYDMIYIYIVINLVGGWFSHPSEKYEFVNWDDEIPNMNGKIEKMATKPPTRRVTLWQTNRTMELFHG